MATTAIEIIKEVASRATILGGSVRVFPFPPVHLYFTLYIRKQAVLRTTWPDLKLKFDLTGDRLFLQCINSGQNFHLGLSPIYPSLHDLPSLLWEMRAKDIMELL